MIGILFLVGAIIVIVVLFNIIRGIFGGPSQTDPQESANKAYNLTEAAKQGRPVQYTIRGPINGQDEHRRIRITVNPNSRRIEIIKGYNNEVIKSEQHDNNRQAYDAFVAAINGSGFTAKRDLDKGTIQDRVCPLGRHFIYEVAPGQNNSYRSWDASCGKAQGDFAGNRDAIRSLFRLQIPNYEDFTRGERL